GLPGRRPRLDRGRLQPPGRGAARRARSARLPHPRGARGARRAGDAMPGGRPGGRCYTADPVNESSPPALDRPRLAAPPGARPAALPAFFLPILLALTGFGMILPLVPFYAERFHARPLEIGLLFASYSLAQLVVAPPLGRLSDRYGRRPLMLLSIAASVAA